jgi:tetratricopeptide (TPR) repeat protein
MTVANPSGSARSGRVLLAVVLALGVLAPAGSWAQEERPKKRDREEKKKAEEREKAGHQYTISDQRTGKRLLEAQELLQNDQHAQARAVLGEFNQEKLNPYERAVVNQMIGYAWANEGNYEESAAALKLALAENALPPGQQLSTRYNLAQLYLMLEQFEQAVEQFESWFKDTEAPTATAYYALASAYYQAGREDEAVAPAEQAVALSEEPKEPWLQLLVALYLDRKRYAEALPLVERLVTSFPKKTYWIQLAAVYFALEEDQKSFAVQQLAYSQGLLTNDRELRRLAQMYLFNDLPYRAASVLEKGLEEGQIEKDQDAWQILGNSWLAAREYERALVPLENAASLSEDGELWLRLAQVHVQREEWDEAVDAVEKALAKGLDKGGPNTPCHGYLLIGIARYNQNRLGPAQSAIGRALSCEKTTEMASRWLQFLEREVARAEALQG